MKKNYIASRHCIFGLLGHIGNRTKGFIIGSFFTSSVLSTDFALSWRKLTLEPPRRAVVAANETTSDAFNKLPLLIRRVACGEKPESGNSTLTTLLETSDKIY